MTLVQIKNIFLLLIAWIGAEIAQLFGGWDSAMTALIIIMAADYVTGILIAAVWSKSPKSETGALESRAGFKGLIRKVLILLAVLIANQLDCSLQLNGIIRTAVILFFIGNEGISVIENMGIMGVPLPEIVRKAFEQLKAKGENVESIKVKEDDEGAS